MEGLIENVFKEILDRNENENSKNGYKNGQYEFGYNFFNVSVFNASLYFFIVTLVYFEDFKKGLNKGKNIDKLVQVFQCSNDDFKNIYKEKEILFVESDLASVNENYKMDK